MRCGLFLIVTFACFSTPQTFAQLPGAPSETTESADATPDTDMPDTPDRVQVNPVAGDEQISARLGQILRATGWFVDPQVNTDKGVVFLRGTADTPTHREWAERVALRTSDVVAVVNQIEIRQRPIWDITPAWQQLTELGRNAVQLIPLLVAGILVLIAGFFLASLGGRLAEWAARDRISSVLLRQVISSVVWVLVFLLGLYVALKVSGLTRLAITVLGGTGLVGLAIGFAFRDIAENYLASILISLNRPFSVGDLVQVEGNKGFVRKVTTRGTLLLTLEGNHIQIPNSTVYKSIITNFSSSPSIRRSFTVGIGYDDSITDAQEVIYGVLRNHEAILSDPPPLVLVDQLAASTVNLNVLFWLDGNKFDILSVSSAVLRQIKAALTDASISMPDEAREIIFPNGVPVMVQQQREESGQRVVPQQRLQPSAKASVLEKDSAKSTAAEGQLANAGDLIQRQADDEKADSGQNLI